MISNECKILKANGRISKIHAELSFGMAITRNGEKIFFSNETSFGAFQFNDFKTGDEVELEFLDTERGLFARSMKCLK